LQSSLEKAMTEKDEQSQQYQDDKHQLSQKVNELEAVVKGQTQQNKNLQDSVLELEQQQQELLDIKQQDQQVIAKLETQVQKAHENISTLQDRFHAKQERQEVDYNKARETIKYLRDENLELNTKLEQEVAALEEKVTEYRLRFEYAQQHIAKQ
jgi:chromosome segregation ATPase